MKRSTQQLLWYGGGALVFAGLAYAIYKANQSTASSSSGSGSGSGSGGSGGSSGSGGSGGGGTTTGGHTWTLMQQPWSLQSGQTYRISVSLPLTGLNGLIAGLNAIVGNNGFTMYEPDAAHSGYTPALPADWPVVAGDSSNNVKVEFTSAVTATFPIAVPSGFAWART